MPSYAIPASPQPFHHESTSVHVADVPGPSLAVQLVIQLPGASATAYLSPAEALALRNALSMLIDPNN
jgi:hypothetical protein